MPGNSPSLMEALTMYKQAGADFGSAVSSLANQRAVIGANNAVQDIKASEKSDADKQAAIRGIANQLTMHLTANGDMPMDRIQGIQNALSPKPPTFQNPFEAYTSSQPGAKQSAIDYEKMMTDEEIRKQQANPLARLKMQNEMDEFTTNKLKDVAKQADPLLASSRSPLGRVQNNLQKVQELEALGQKDPSKWTKYDQQEFATGLNSVMTGGVGTEGGVKELLPNTLRQQAAALQEKITSDPAALKQPEFAKMYQDMTARMKNVMQQQQGSAIKQILRSNVNIAKRNPDAYSALAESLLGGDKSRIVNGRLKFDSDEQESQVTKDINDALNSGRKATDVVAQRDGKPVTFGDMIQSIQQHPNFLGAMSSDTKTANRLRLFLRAQQNSGE